MNDRILAKDQRLSGPEDENLWAPSSYLGAARHLLHAEGYPEGHSGGEFTDKLIAAWQHADEANKARLAFAYPAVGWAVEVMSRPGGTDALRKAVLK